MGGDVSLGVRLSPPASIPHSLQHAPVARAQPAAGWSGCLGTGFQ